MVDTVPLPQTPPKKRRRKCKAVIGLVWCEINRLFILFHLTTSKKRVAMNCWAERKGCCCHLIPFTLRPRNGGMRPLRLWQNSWSYGMCRNPTDPQFFEYEQVHSTKQSSPTCQHISSQKNLSNQTFTKLLSLWWQPLSMIPLTWSVKDLKCWILWSSTPRHWWHLILWASSSQVKQLQWTWQYWASEICQILVDSLDFY